MILGSGLLLAYLTLLIPVARRRVIHTNPFFFAGLSLSLLHNFVDFNSSLFLVQLILLIGYIVIHHRHAENIGMVKLPIAVPLVALVLGAGLLSFGAERYGTTGMPPRFEAFRAAVNATTEQTEIQTQLQEYKGHHPADIFADLVVAKRLTELECTKTGRLG